MFLDGKETSAFKNSTQSKALLEDRLQLFSISLALLSVYEIFSFLEVKLRWTAVFDDVMLLVSIAFSGGAVRLTAPGVVLFTLLPDFPVLVLPRVVLGMMDESLVLEVSVRYFWD